MKKIIFTFVILFAILFGGIYVCRFTDLPVTIAISLEDLYYKITDEEEVVYDENFVVNELSTSNTTNTFYYNSLNDNEKRLYTLIINGIKNLETKVYLRKYEFLNEESCTSEVGNAIFAISLDHPEIYYLNENYTISTNTSIFGKRVYVLLNYDVSSKEELDEQIKALNMQIEEIFNIALADEDDEFNVELKLHDYLAKNIRYYNYTDINSIPKECHGIYGTLMNKEAVCDGFAETLKIMLDKKNIKSITVTGKLESEAHEWNKVCIGDKWYNVDITSNKSINDHEDVVVHSYFNVTDEIIKSTHSFDKEEILPQATSLDDNYFYRNDKVIKNIDNFNTRFAKIFGNSDTTRIFEVWCEDVPNVPDKMVSALRAISNNGFLNRNDTKFSYYKILNSYVLVK